MGAGRVPQELSSAQLKIEKSYERVEELKQLAKRAPNLAISFAKRLLTEELGAIHAQIQTAHAQGFHDEAQRCESYLYKRQADVALAVLYSLTLETNDGLFWSGRAEKWLRESVKLYPTMQARFQLAVLYASLERYAEAMNEAQIVAKSDDPQICTSARQFIREIIAGDDTRHHLRGDDEMASFKCRECGAAIPVKEHGALAGMEVEGPCPKCGCPMPFVCPCCNKQICHSLVCDHGQWKGVCCMKGGCSPCYIATACYGSYDHPDVLVLRRFRDDMLWPTAFGRLFIKIYYAISPPMAKRLGQVQWLSGIIRRWFLEPLVKKLR